MCRRLRRRYACGHPHDNDEEETGFCYAYEPTRIRIALPGTSISFRTGGEGEKVYQACKYYPHHPETDLLFIEKCNRERQHVPQNPVVVHYPSTGQFENWEPECPRCQHEHLSKTHDFNEYCPYCVALLDIVHGLRNIYNGPLQRPTSLKNQRMQAEARARNAGESGSRQKTQYTKISQSTSSYDKSYEGKKERSHRRDDYGTVKEFTGASYGLNVMRRVGKGKSKGCALVMEKKWDNDEFA